MYLICFIQELESRSWNSMDMLPNVLLCCYKHAIESQDTNKETKMSSLEYLAVMPTPIIRHQESSNQLNLIVHNWMFNNKEQLRNLQLNWFGICTHPTLSSAPSNPRPKPMLCCLHTPLQTMEYTFMSKTTISDSPFMDSFYAILYLYIDTSRYGNEKADPSSDWSGACEIKHYILL